MIPRVPLGGRGWLDGVGVRGCPTHTCIGMHACRHVYDIIGNSQGFPQWGLPFAIEVIMFNVYMCMCMCACMLVHVCGTPPMPHTPIYPPTTPRAAGSPKHQNSISLKPIEKFLILFEDSLPLNSPELI